MKIVIKHPMRPAQVEEIGNELEDMQAVVGGYIEVITTDVPGVVCVLNEEGKIFHMPTNMVFGFDMIVGTVFFCRSEGEKLTSLTDEQAEKLTLKYSKYGIVNF